MDFVARNIKVGSNKSNINIYINININIKVGSNKIKLHLWDTAGQERFRFLSRSYYRNSVGVVVAYSILRRSTFEGVERWVEEAREYAGPVAPTIVVVGCKLDLIDIGCKRQVK